MNRLLYLRRFYELLEAHSELQGGRLKLADMKTVLLPQRGVYFFFDENEIRRDSGAGPRIVRVGTHALTAGSKSTLRQRLAQHRGTKRSGGNHRGSIFRNLVGQAFLSRGVSGLCPSWGVANDMTKASSVLHIDRHSLVLSELPVEQYVSDYLAKLTFTFLNIDDEPGANSRRGFVEQNSIALLSNFERPSLDTPSLSWLGNMSNRELVVGSGLWNQRHVSETFNHTFLDYLESIIGSL